MTTKPVIVHVDIEIYKTLKKLAIDLDTSMKQLVCDAIDKVIIENTKGDK